MYGRIDRANSAQLNSIGPELKRCKIGRKLWQRLSLILLNFPKRKEFANNAALSFSARAPLRNLVVSPSLISSNYFYTVIYPSVRRMRRMAQENYGRSRNEKREQGIPTILAARFVVVVSPPGVGGQFG